MNEGETHIFFFFFFFFPPDSGLSNIFEIFSQETSLLQRNWSARGSGLLSKFMPADTYVTVRESRAHS